MIILVEGLFMGALLMAYLAVGIRNRPFKMAFVYHEDVKERCFEKGYITREELAKSSRRFYIFTLFFMILAAILVYGVNGARHSSGFYQLFFILSVVNLVDRILIDEVWVGHTKAWEIPGCEDLKPYINGKDRAIKWLFGTVGFFLISLLISVLMNLILR